MDTVLVATSITTKTHLPCSTRDGRTGTSEWNSTTMSSTRPNLSIRPWSEAEANPPRPSSRVFAAFAGASSTSCRARCCGTCTLLDLPNEILFDIFKRVEQNDGSCFELASGFRRPHAAWKPSQGIKALRLACRQTCDISSQLLVRMVI
ncbi:hypothetical protein B0T26DRAFT_715215 [Lasiosphaeria miniovina]|uniref:F-box domain-containing protein n=1 Tax=Lasiosphaeria miniovina TaxID=1954250 RepID=A0AA40ABT4_9PEZI|nr:uncharacterized protein B0T26DRAFT_715215 [Lasiosphaeria miniovina]KAK0712768.1 hypothetical protein B0T26DRAFT_715215 [Lasiosphaeria miniovina]